MLTARGHWFLLAMLTLLAVALVVDHSTLALVALTLLSWFLAAWLDFVVRLRLVKGQLRVARHIQDERGPVKSLWAGRTFRVRARLLCDGPAGLAYVRVTDRVPV